MSDKQSMQHRYLTEEDYAALLSAVRSRGGYLLTGLNSTHYVGQMVTISKVDEDGDDIGDAQFSYRVSHGHFYHNPRDAIADRDLADHEVFYEKDAVPASRCVAWMLKGLW